jgi:hypothetical protein
MLKPFHPRGTETQRGGTPQPKGVNGLTSRWAIFGVAIAIVAAAALGAGEPVMRKVRDFVIYEEAKFYAAFPSIVRRPEGELVLAFRRAPARVAFGEPKESHVDPNSYLVQMRSSDGGATWTPEPRLIHAHPFGGSQDPCLLQLRDGTLLCASYAWTFIKPEVVPKLRAPVFEIVPGVVFLGGYLVRSDDGGRTWQRPMAPPHIEPEVYHDLHGEPLPAYNRGALCEGRDGRIFWVVAANDTAKPRKTSNHLLVSGDQGATWRYAAPVAIDAKVSFNEASVYETPGGDLVAFLRTAGFGDHACLARSRDGGRSFQPWQDMGFQGHPLHSLRLPNARVLLVYGYRHKPYGVRARVLDAECTNFASAPEFVIRDDGGTTDLGYPWSVQLDGRRVLVVYYFNRDGGPRHIAGSVLELE